MAEAVGEAALERALDDTDSLVLLYQPIHDARTGAVYSAEALLRQRRESGELREASIIHEAAENSRSQLLFRLDHHLVRRAYTDASHWQSRFPDVRLNVNLSPREFQEGNVIDRLTDLVTSCGVNTRLVNIELTETSYIDKPKQTMDVLESLKKLGISVWLDDFGTGHSTLEHLQHFPIDGIKIPGSFVKPLPGDARCAAIVRNLITLAHDLGVPVIAEEVEHREQLDFLLSLGCDYIQGYFFSRPMEAEQLAELLTRGPSVP